MGSLGGFRIGSGYVPWICGVAVMAAAAFFLFGLVGFRSIIAFAVLFVVPPLMFLGKTSLDVEEKIFFSLFIGLGLFSLVVFAVNQLLPSFRLSAVAAFVLVVLVAFLVVPKILQRRQQKLQ